jgi:hypothetical protein
MAAVRVANDVRSQGWEGVSCAVGADQGDLDKNV